jgi:hypothetical protein
MGITSANTATVQQLIDKICVMDNSEGQVTYLDGEDYLVWDSELNHIANFNTLTNMVEISFDSLMYFSVREIMIYLDEAITIAKKLKLFKRKFHFVRFYGCKPIDYSSVSVLDIDVLNEFIKSYGIIRNEY